MKFWNFNNLDTEAELRIEGDIVDDSWAWLYEWYGEPCASPNNFRQELEACKGKPLTVWIDSYGGDVFAAAGIYNALKNYPGKVTVKIDGKAMSAATVIAMAGEKILMSPTSIFMIHNPLTSASGYASDLRKTADVLDTVKETIVNAYKIKTGLPRAKISQLMDEETYMTAQDAISEGFIDEMLFVENPAILNFSFSRTAISVLNSASDSIRQMTEKIKGSEPPVQPDPPDEGTPENIQDEPDTQAQFKNLLDYFEMNERSL